MSVGTIRVEKILSTLLLISVCTFVVRAQQSTTNTAQPSSPEASVTSKPAEDLYTLSLGQTHLHPMPSIEGEKSEFPEFTRELIQVQWRSWDPIDLYVILPRNVKKPHAILYLYSYPSESTRFMDNQYCIRLTRGGFAAIGLVSALTGHRYHDRPMKEWFVSQLHDALTMSVHDVQMVLDYLATRGDVDVSHVGFFGQGSGATIAILSATVDPRIGPLDLLDPWGDWPDWLAHSTLVPEEERSSYLKPEFLAKIAPLDPLNELPRLRQPLRLQLVADDEVTPTVAKSRVASVAPAQTLVVRYEDTKSLFRQTGGGRLFEWVKDELKAPSPASAEATAKDAHTPATMAASTGASSSR